MWGLLSHKFVFPMAEKRRVGFDPAFAKLLADHSARVIAGQKVWRTQIQPGELQKSSLRVATIGQPGGYGPFGNYGGNPEFADARTRINPHTGSAFTLERVPRRLDPDPAQGAPHTHHGSDSVLAGGALHGGGLDVDALKTTLLKLVHQMRAEEAKPVAERNHAKIAQLDRAIYGVQGQLYVAMRAARRLEPAGIPAPDEFDAVHPENAVEAMLAGEPGLPPPEGGPPPPPEGGPPPHGAGMHGGDFWSTMNDIKTGLARGVKIINPVLQPVLELAGAAPIPGAALAAKAVGTVANLMGGSAKSAYVRRLIAQGKFDPDKIGAQWREPMGRWHAAALQAQQRRAPPPAFKARQRRPPPSPPHESESEPEPEQPQLRRGTRNRRPPQVKFGVYGSGLHGADSDSDSDSSDSSDSSVSDDAMQGGSAKSAYIRRLLAQGKFDPDKIGAQWREPMDRWHTAALKAAKHSDAAEAAAPPPTLKFWWETKEGRKAHKKTLKAMRRRARRARRAARGGALVGGSGDIRGYPAEAQLARAQAYMRAMSGRQRPNQGFDGPARSGFDELASGEQDAQMLRDILNLVEQAEQDTATVSTRQALSEALLSHASFLSDASLAQVVQALGDSGLPQGVLATVEQLARRANVSASERVMLLKHALKLYREAVADGRDGYHTVMTDPAIARLVPAQHQNAPVEEPLQAPANRPPGYLDNPLSAPAQPVDLDDSLLADDQNDDFKRLRRTREEELYDVLNPAVAVDMSDIPNWAIDTPGVPADDDDTDAMKQSLRDSVRRQIDAYIDSGDYDKAADLIDAHPEFIDDTWDDMTVDDYDYLTGRRYIDTSKYSQNPQSVPNAGDVISSEFLPQYSQEDADPAAAAAVEGAENAEFSLAAVPPPPLPTAPNSAAAFVAPLPGQGGTQGDGPIDAGNPPNASAAPPVQETIAEQAERREAAAGGPETVTGADALAASGVGNATNALTSPEAAAARRRLEGTTAPPGDRPGGAAAHLSTFFTPPPVTRDEAFVQEYAELRAQRDLLVRASDNPDTDEETKARIDQRLVEIQARMDEIYEFMRKGGEPTPRSAETAAFASPATAGYSPGSPTEGRLSTAAAYPALTRFVESRRRVGATPGLQSSPYSPEQNDILVERTAGLRQRMPRRQTAMVGPASGQR